MTSRAQTFAEFAKDGRIARRIQRETGDIVKKMKAAGCTPEQSKAVREAAMFALVMVECQHRANRHIDQTFPYDMRSKMLAVIHSAANAID